MNQITRIKLEKYIKSINQKDPQYKLSITKENNTYYYNINNENYNRIEHFTLLRDQYEINKEIATNLINHLKHLYEYVHST